MFWNNGRRILSSFAFRLTLKYSLFLGFTLVCVFFLSCHFLSVDLLKKADAQLAEEASEIEYLYNNRDLSHVRDEISMESRMKGTEDMFFRFMPVGQRGFIQFSADQWSRFDFSPIMDLMPGKGNKILLTRTLGPRHEHLRLILVTLDDGSMIQIGKSLQEYNDLIMNFKRIFGLSMLIMMITGTLLGWINLRLAMKGVNRVTGTARSIMEGHLDQRVSLGKEGNEIEELGKVFNEMISKIQALMIELKEVTHSIAHDLRSPITRMRGIAETTRMGREDVEEYRQMAGIVVEECDRLGNMIGTLLEIAEADAGLNVIKLTDTDITRVIREGHDLFRPVIEDKGITSSLILPDGPVHLLTDVPKLQRVVANLLDNAIKFTPERGRIDLQLKDNANYIELKFRDSGVGIEKAVINRIFDPFFRCDSSRTTVGNGLGLSLVKSIVQSLKGEIVVNSTPGQGSEFILILPKNPNPSPPV